MAHDAYTAIFRYRLGQYVRWAEDPQQHYLISQRRWTERDIMPPATEYLLLRVLPDDAESEARGRWAYEADLIAWED